MSHPFLQIVIEDSMERHERRVLVKDQQGLVVGQLPATKWSYDHSHVDAYPTLSVTVHAEAATLEGTRG